MRPSLERVVAGVRAGQREAGAGDGLAGADVRVVEAGVAAVEADVVAADLAVTERVAIVAACCRRRPCWRR